MTDHSAGGRHRRRRPERPRRRPPAVVVALAAALPLSALVVWHASYAAFSGTTQNASNQFSSGTVTLTDDDSNGALFSATGLKPGSTGTSCITVDYAGSLATAGVKLYVAGGDLTHSAATAPYLASYLTMKVEEGTGGGYNNCTGFTPSSTIINSTDLNTLATTFTDYSNGAGTWAPSAPGSMVYRFTYTLTSPPNTVQGQTETVKFTWEAQNN